MPGTRDHVTVIRMLEPSEGVAKASPALQKEIEKDLKKESPKDAEKVVAAQKKEVKPVIVVKKDEPVRPVAEEVKAVKVEEVKSAPAASTDVKKA